MPTDKLHQEALRQRLHDLEMTEVDLSWVSVGQDGEEIRKRYRVLEQPCHGFVAALRDGGCLELLAEHAQLEPVPSLRPFPFRVPRPRPKPGSVRIWSPGAEQETDDATANARLLLWFAVAYAPDEFGADTLYWQQLLQSLRLYCEHACEDDREVRPFARIKDGVFHAASALIDAAHDEAATHLTGAAEPSGIPSGEDDLAAFPTLTSIAHYLRIDASTLWRWRKAAIIAVERRDGKYLCSKSQLARLRRRKRRRKS